MADNIKTVAVSSCLLGNNCKYNGKNNYNADLCKYLEDKTVIAVCPEVTGGLPTPRAAAEIVNGRVMNCRGESVDEQFRNGAKAVIDMLKNRAEKIDAVVLQSRSPSCGVKEIYDGTFSGKKIKGSGVFAALAKESGFNVYDAEDFMDYIMNK